MASSFTKIIRGQRCFLTRVVIGKRFLNFGESVNLKARSKWRQSTIFCNTQESNVTKRKFHSNSTLHRSEFFKDTEVFKRTQEEANKCEFPVRYLEFNACQSLYTQLNQMGEDRPAAGVNFNLAYIDTNPTADKKVPIAVCLHGAPGGHWDFNDLTLHLHRKGVRVIAVNFPGYGWTAMDEGKEFTSSAEEKAVLVQEFLQVLGIESVDLGIIHSAGVYPGLVLCSEDLNTFRSIVMINPGGLGYHKVLRPFWYIKFHARFYKNPILRPILLTLMKAGLMAIRFGNTNTHQMSVAMESLSSVPYEEYKDYPRSMGLRGVPACLIYSLNDSVVEKALSIEMSKLLQIQGTTTYDRERRVKTSSHKKGDGYSWQHVFDSGGHFLMKRFPDEINKIVEEFLDQVVKKKKEKN